MSTQSSTLKSVTHFQKQPRFAPHQIALAIAWLVTTIAYVIMLYLGVRNTRNFAMLRDGLTIVHAAVLLWYLACSGPSISQLPEFPPLVFANWRFGRLAVVLVIALLLCLTVLSDIGMPILFLLFLVSTVLILVARCRQITARSVALGIAVSLIAFVAGGTRRLHGVCRADSIPVAAGRVVT